MKATVSADLEDKMYPFQTIFEETLTDRLFKWLEDNLTTIHRRAQKRRWRHLQWDTWNIAGHATDEEEPSQWIWEWDTRERLNTEATEAVDDTCRQFKT
jgi:hypothetical protein